MGVDPARGAEEEDVAHEEAAQADGGQSIEGRDGAEQVLELREDKEDALAVSILCAVYVGDLYRLRKHRAADCVVALQSWFKKGMKGPITEGTSVAEKS